MKQANIALQSLGACIKTYSSCIDSLHDPNNILDPSESTLWATGEGLPQFVIVSLEDLGVSFKSISEVGFMLWHDYDTNPKEIQLWVAETTEQEFVFWARFELEQKKGIQLYEIKPLPQRYIYLKISITQTYGAFQTYLNQVFFMAESTAQRPHNPKQIHPKKTKQIQPKNNKQTHPRQNKKQLGLQDLENDLNHLVQIDRRISRSKSNQKQQKKLNRMSRQSQLEQEQYQIANINSKERHPFRAEVSKGSLSSNKPGRSIYFRSEDYYNEDKDSHRYVSNDYQSSSSNAKEHFKQHKPNQKLSSQESEEYSHSLNSNNTPLSPSLNVTNSLSQKNNFLSSKEVFEARERQEDNHRSYKRLIEREKVQNSKKKTKEYSYDDEDPELSSRPKPNPGIAEEDLEQGHLQQMQQSQAEEFTSNMIDNTPKYNQLSGNQDESQQQSQQEGENYNAAILALSKHVVKLQDNMESIQRKVEVLDMKVTHSHQKIQQLIMKKVSSHVEGLVDRKLTKIWSLKNFSFMNNLNPSNQSHSKSKQHENDSPKGKQGDQPQFSYKKNLTKEFFKSDYYAQQENMAQMRDRTKTKRRSKQKRPDPREQAQNYQNSRAQRRLKGSKSFADVTHKQNRAKQQIQTVSNKAYNKSGKGPNQQYIASLLQRLNVKLKEREVKLSKIQAKSKDKKPDEEPDKRKAYGLKERSNNQRQRCNEVYNNYYY